MGGGDEAQAVLLNSPYTVLGLSDAGAHITYDPGYGATTFLLSYWVRESGVLSLEEAVRKVTFVPASIYGMYDRGLLRPGLAADMVVFDPDTIDLEDVEEVHDLPAGGTRLSQSRSSQRTRPEPRSSAVARAIPSTKGRHASASG